MEKSFKELQDWENNLKYREDIVNTIFKYIKNKWDISSEQKKLLIEEFNKKNK